MYCKSVLRVCVCVRVCTEADIHPGTVCHRLSCRKRPIISSHGSSGGVKCVICVGSNWQPTLVEADWGEGRAAVTQPPPALTQSPPFTVAFGNVTLCCWGLLSHCCFSALTKKLQICKCKYIFMSL